MNVNDEVEIEEEALSEIDADTGDDSPVTIDENLFETEVEVDDGEDDEIEVEDDGTDTVDVDDTPIHNHDDRYYTKSETNELLDEKQDVLPSGQNDQYLHKNATTGAMEWSDVDAQTDWGDIGGNIADQEDLVQVLAQKQDIIDDLNDIREGAEAGATAYQKPDTGIPKTDLASDVQTSLTKADSAIGEAPNDGNQYARQSGTWATVVGSTIGYTRIWPAKGQLISMTLGNTTPLCGTQDLYRVLSISNGVAEVVAMYDQRNVRFSQSGSTSSTYEGSYLDTFLNTTWYTNYINDAARTAIVDKTFVQDQWTNDSMGSPIYSGYYGTSNPGTTSYMVSLLNSSYGNSITRHVYALSVQDVISYVKDATVGDGQLQNYNVWKMLWNTTSDPSGSGSVNYSWLRSAHYGDSSFGVTLDDSKLTGIYSNGECGAHPAFQIDLSKIDWSFVRG